jgi:hypothetical protein
VVSRLGWPGDTKALGMVWLWDDVEMDMVNFLMSHPPIILKDVVIRPACSLANLLGDG